MTALALDQLKIIVAGIRRRLVREVAQGDAKPVELATLDKLAAELTAEQPTEETHARIQ